MAETAVATPLDIDEIPFSDLLLLLSPGPADDALRRGLLDTVGTALSRRGSGLLAISDVPRAGALRRRLLPLARRLALMDLASRAQLLKKHGLGSDVPLKKIGRSVSSFAQLLRYSGELRLHEFVRETENDKNNPGNPEEVVGVDRLEVPKGDDIDRLGELFEELGLLMMELGILVARACDIVVGGNQLEQSITDFGTAKARLIHYHSQLDNIIIKESNTKRKTEISKTAATPYKSCIRSLHGSCIKTENEATVLAEKEKGTNDSRAQCRSGTISLTNLWQEWHYDYGILTVLTAPLFLCSIFGDEFSVSKECSAPDGHTYLQLFNRGKIFSVRCSLDSFVVQVGEAADILSGGKIRSRLHAVSRPFGLPNISRETFVVFLQPSWDKTLPYAGYPFDDEDESSDQELTLTSDVSTRSLGEDMLMQEILRKIPPLSSRLKEGMTFAEFSRQTTKQYYGGGGIQQNN